MENDKNIDFAALEDYVYANRLMTDGSVHGLSHWRQVESNGLLLSKKTHADETVVRLFALFHDSRRVTDSYDESHGADGAAFAESLRGKLFDLDDGRFERLLHACRMHTTERSSGDATVDTCYDADRLDLGRVYIFPEFRRMATNFGKELAKKLEKVPIEGHRAWLCNVASKI